MKFVMKQNEETPVISQDTEDEEGDDVSGEGPADPRSAAIGWLHCREVGAEL